MYRVTSRLIQMESFNDVTTPYYNQDDITLDIAIEELSTNSTLLTAYSNYPSGPQHMNGKPNETDTPSSFITQIIVSLAMLVFVITICVIIAFRHLQNSQKQQRREHLRTEKVYARPFDDIVIDVNEHEVIGLTEIGPTATPTGTTTN